MRKLTIVFLILSSAVILQAQVKDLQEENTFYDFLSGYNVMKANGDTIKHIERLTKLYANKLFPTGNCSIAASAIAEYAQNYEQYKSDTYNPSWIELGPTGSSNPNTCNNGRIHNIVFDPNYDAVTNKVVYACSSHGGLWRSENDGNLWQQVNTDTGIPVTTVSDVAIHPTNSNTIFISTGVADEGIVVYNTRAGHSNPVFSIGVYRTVNYGSSWESMNAGLESYINEGFTIREIEINPVNPDQIFIATSLGVFRCNNANSETPVWESVLNGLNNYIDTEFKGLKFKPDNPQVIFASGQDIYCSTNGGVTWESMTGSGTGLDFASMPNFSVSRINIAVTKANVNILYAHIVGRENNNNKMYLYKFNGISWDSLFSETSLSAWEANVNALENTFTNLYKGISLEGTGSFMTSNIVENNFTNNYISLYIADVSGAVINSNIIETPVNYSSFGFVIRKSNNWHIEDNQFSSQSVKNDAIGILLQANYKPDEIYKNKFSNLRYAVFSKGENPYI